LTNFNKREYMRQYMARSRLDPVHKEKNRVAACQWRKAKRKSIRKQNVAWRAAFSPSELTVYNNRRVYRRSAERSEEEIRKDLELQLRAMVERFESWKLAI